MKLHHILFYVTLTVFLFFSSSIFAQKKFIIVLDAGHGGKDIGATRKYSDLGTVMEKDVTLAIILKLGRLLEKDKDFKVIYTRKIDEFPSLIERTTLANRNHADLFLSVNINSSKSFSISGNSSSSSPINCSNYDSEFSSTIFIIFNFLFSLSSAFLNILNSSFMLSFGSSNFTS